MELIGIARNPVPNGAVPGSFITRDGFKIRYALWPRTADKRLGTVCLFGGRGEFIEKYFETITDLRRRGFAVATMDWRGQGGSDRLLKNPRKGHVEDFADFDGDLKQFMGEIVLPDCPAPYYGMAHSMGGHLLLRSARTKMCWFDRIIVSAPMIDLTRDIIHSPALRLYLEALVLLGFGDFYIPGGTPDAWELMPFEVSSLTSDPLRYDRVRDMSEGRALAEPRFADDQLAARRDAFDHAAERLPLRILDPGAAADHRGGQRHRRIDSRHRSRFRPG